MIAPQVDEETVSIDQLRAKGYAGSQIPARLSLERALLKASHVAPADGTFATLAADTVVAVDDTVYGKAATRMEAERMLRALSGATHQVYTAVAIRRHGPWNATRCVTAVVTSRVTMAAIGDDEIDWYLNTEEWVGVAGAYRIQGAGAAFIAGISGSPDAVMGLPLQAVSAMLRALTPLS